LFLEASAQEIGAALDLPWDVAVCYTGDTQAVESRILYSTAGLLGFPSGRDGDFLMLSSGVASQIDTKTNTSGSQGTDLGEKGESGDTATISFTLPVPTSSLPQKLKFDFMFLSEEYPEYVGSSYNDFFRASVNGTNIAMDQFGHVVDVNSVFFDGNLATTGTFFDGRTSMLTASYSIPQGVTSLSVVLSVGDVGDGVFDSAVFLDNFRTVPQQFVYLNFDGKDVGSHFGFGTRTVIPAFAAQDVGSSLPRDQVIADILGRVQQDYAGLDIVFTTTSAGLPSSDQYTELIIGGGDQTPVQVSAWARPFYDAWGLLLGLGFLPPDPVPMDTFEHYTGVRTDRVLLGMASEIDIGNQKPGGQAGVFARRVASGAQDGLEEVSKVISHELAHNLGLRHVDNNTDLMYFMNELGVNQVFQDQMMNRKPDEINWIQQLSGDTRQNDVKYLEAVLGKTGGPSTSYLATSFHGQALSASPWFTFELGSTALKLYNVTVGTFEPGSDISPQIMHFDQLSGPVQMNLAAMGSGTRLVLFGSSSPTHDPDIFLGAPAATPGVYSLAVPLFNADSQFNEDFSLGKVGNTGKFTPVGTASLTQSQYGAIQWVPRAGSTYTDSDGDTVKVRLTGPGRVAVVQEDEDGDGRGPIDQILLQNTNPAKSSSLTITVVKSKTGDGQVGIGKVEGSGLASFSAAAANLVGSGIDLAGALGSLKIWDVSNGADIRATPKAGQSVSITAHVIGDGTSFAMGDGLVNLKAARFGDGDLTAGAIGTLSVSGDRKLSVEGDFAANLTLSGIGVPAYGKTISSVTVKGALDPSVWDVTGKVGTLTLSGTVGAAGQPWELRGAASVVSLTLGDVADAEVNVGVLGAVKAIRWQDGSLTAAAVTSITTTGVAATATVTGISGDFGADVTLSYTGTKSALASLTVAGWLTGATISSAGAVGTVSLGGIRDSTLSAGDLAGAYSKITGVTVKGIKTAPTASFVNSKISAWTLGTVSVKGVQTVNGQAGFGIQGHTITSYTRDGKKYASKGLPGLVIDHADDYTAELV
jgi:hypothetical protein